MAKFRYIHSNIWDDSWFADLSRAGKLLFVYLISNDSTSLSGFYERSQRMMAMHTGLEVAHIPAALKELEPKIIFLDGWVCIKNYTRHQNVSNNPKVLAFIEKDLQRVPAHVVSEANHRFYATENIPTPIPTPNTKSMDRVSIPSKTAKNKGKKEKGEGVEKLGIASPYSDEFERAWAAYPRKVGKGAAWKAWAMLHPTKQLAELIIAKVALYKSTKQWQKDGGQFIPHFATFLNQRRFDDDPESGSSTPLSDKYAGL